MNGMFKHLGVQFLYDDDPAGGGEPESKKEPEPKTKATEFAAWIATQPEDIQKAYAADIAGLKSGLDKERQNGSDLRKAQARLKELETAEAERSRAQMSKEEQLATDLAAAQSSAAKAAAELKDLHLRTAVEREAVRLGFFDSEDAVKMIDLSKLTLEDGKVIGAKEALEGLAKAKPYLIHKADSKDPGNKSKSGNRKDPASEDNTPRAPLVHL